MSWFSRKLTNSDYTNNQEVIQEYFDKKEQKLLQEQEIKKFWQEYEDEYYNG